MVICHKIVTDFNPTKVSEFKNSTDARGAPAILSAYRYAEVQTINLYLNGYRQKKVIKRSIFRLYWLANSFYDKTDLVAWM